MLLMAVMLMLLQSKAGVTQALMVLVKWVKLTLCLLLSDPLSSFAFGKRNCLSARLILYLSLIVASIFSFGFHHHLGYS